MYRQISFQIHFSVVGSLRKCVRFSWWYDLSTSLDSSMINVIQSNLKSQIQNWSIEQGAAGTAFCEPTDCSTLVVTVVNDGKGDALVTVSIDRTK